MHPRLVLGRLASARCAAAGMQGSPCCLRCPARRLSAPSFRPPTACRQEPAGAREARPAARADHQLVHLPARPGAARPAGRQHGGRHVSGRLRRLLHHLPAGRCSRHWRGGDVRRHAGASHLQGCGPASLAALSAVRRLGRGGLLVGQQGWPAARKPARWPLAAPWRGPALHSPRPALERAQRPRPSKPPSRSLLSNKF